MAEPGRHAMAELQTPLADHDGGLARAVMSPDRNPVERAPDGAWNETRIALEIIVGANVDENRALWCSDKASKLFRRDGIE
jgi:hypothetical protein